MSVANVLLFVTAAAAVQNLDLVNSSNSEVMASWTVNPDLLFDLSHFIINYFTESEPKGTPMNIGTNTTYQISDLIPGESYTVEVIAYYITVNDSREYQAEPTKDTVTLNKIGMFLSTAITSSSKEGCDICIFVILYTYVC